MIYFATMAYALKLRERFGTARIEVPPVSIFDRAR